MERYGGGWKGRGVSVRKCGGEIWRRVEREGCECEEVWWRDMEEGGKEGEGKEGERRGRDKEVMK